MAINTPYYYIDDKGLTWHIIRPQLHQSQCLDIDPNIAHTYTEEYKLKIIEDKSTDNTPDKDNTSDIV